MTDVVFYNTWTFDLSITNYHLMNFNEKSYNTDNYRRYFFLWWNR